MEYKVLINITSYNREKMLNNILNQLKGYDVIVWDDNSNFKIDSVKFYKFHKNYGKKKAWRKFQRIFNFILKDYSNYDYYFLLPDDVVLCDNFIEKSIELYKGIKDNRKICLSLLSDVRVENPNWTGVYPLDKGDVILTHWSDLCMLFDLKYLEEADMTEIQEDRWDSNPRLGSGVGSVISRNLYRKNYNQYHVKKTLCTHGGHKSEMNHHENKEQ